MNSQETNGKVAQSKDSATAELFEAISHTTRIQILQVLSQTKLSFGDLKRKLGISSSGNLAHHLNKLVGFIEAKYQGSYELTDQGREAIIAIEAVRMTKDNWIAITYVMMSALIFYSLYLTITITTGWINIITAMSEAILGPWAHLMTPISAMISTTIFFVISWLMTLRRLQKGTPNKRFAPHKTHQQYR
ncbi:MAG: winged helix-turn-helix domain-containing protein [Candidatus Hermodarchaeota archaeon]|nr:winged helix-turn-helix domain-containing protein [Candidatus Hermodarchaeota archaeon]